MVRPYTKNGLLNDGKKNIGIKINEEPTDKKMKNKIAGYCV
jgi:ribosomal protein S17E